MRHPTLLYRPWDWADGAVPSQRATAAEAKLRKMGYDHLADHAVELRQLWTQYTGEIWVAEVRSAVQTLVRHDPAVPWRLFLFACNWLSWPEEAFPLDWQPESFEVNRG